MGMRGPRNNLELARRHPATDHPITARAITIYRQMRKMDLSEGPGGDEWWALNAALNKELHLMSFPVYEDPSWEHDYRPQETALLRFHELKRASRKTPKRRKLYKWET
ncbi:MAG: hypothetical protein WCF55_16635 [Pseudolabrys sp.]